MAVFHPPPGARVLEMWEVLCSCGHAPTHLVLQPATYQGQQAGDVGIVARGWCNACSPVLERGTENPPEEPAQEPPWWMRLLVQGMAKWKRA